MSLINHLPMRTSHWSKKKLKCFKTLQVFAACTRILELSWLFIESRQKLSSSWDKSRVQIILLISQCYCWSQHKFHSMNHNQGYVFFHYLVENFWTSYHTSFLLHGMCGPLVSIIGHFLKVTFLKKLLHSRGKASRTYHLPKSKNS